MGAAPRSSWRNRWPWGIASGPYLVAAARLGTSRSHQGGRAGVSATTDCPPSGAWAGRGSAPRGLAAGSHGTWGEGGSGQGRHGVRGVVRTQGRTTRHQAGGLWLRALVLGGLCRRVRGGPQQGPGNGGGGPTWARRTGSQPASAERAPVPRPRPGAGSPTHSVPRDTGQPVTGSPWFAGRIWVSNSPKSLDASAPALPS